MLDIEAASAGEEAGLRLGDIILQVDETTVRSPEDVLRAYSKSKDLFVIIRVDRVVTRRKGSMVTISYETCIEENRVILMSSVVT